MCTKLVLQKYKNVTKKQKYQKLHSKLIKVKRPIWHFELQQNAKTNINTGITTKYICIVTIKFVLYTSIF